MRDKRRVVILGGGVSGLAVGYYLARDGWLVTVIEKRAFTGGLCGSFQQDGFTLDYGPHKLYSILPGILDEIRRILFRRAPRTYEEYIVSRFGRDVYELVFAPLAEKVWGDPRMLAAELARTRIPSGGAAELVLRLLKLRSHGAHVDASHFLYPRGGFGVFCDLLAAGIREHGGEIVTNATPIAFERAGNRILSVTARVGDANRRCECDLVISSIPVRALTETLCPEDEQALAAARALKLRDLILVYLVVDRDRIFKDHWLFFPEREYPFSRLFEQKAMDEGLAPQGQTVLCCDLTCEPGDQRSSASDAELIALCTASLEQHALIAPGEARSGFVRRAAEFYPMYLVDYEQHLARLYARLKTHDNLLLTGRLGMFNYNNADHCLDMGQVIAARLGAGRGTREIWDELEKRVSDYRIVD
ncbi:MAG: FAD-dependent oxidoreductase [Vicinamibacteria bacterium]|nr:FAD-dependent oxidoreductase [Vicinamibacteria bacterium]